MKGPFERLRSAPGSALLLGLAGLLPFIGIAVIVTTTTSPVYAWWLTTLAQYAAVILSFVGALQWGLTMRVGHQGGEGWLRYGWSVVPSLAGWLALQLPVWTALRVEAGVLVLCYAVDRHLAMGGEAPEWFLPFRLLLTVVGSASLLVASYA